MSIALQILINSIVSGLLLSLFAIAFTYVFQVTRVFHLAQAGVFAMGGLIAWQVFGLTSNWLFTLFLSLLVSLSIMFVVERWIYAPLVKSKGQNITLIASMGVYTIIINVLAIIWGNENKIFSHAINGSIEFAGIILTNVQKYQFVFSILVLMFLLIFLHFSKMLIELKAMADNEIISSIYGVNISKLRLYAIMIGTILTVLGAILKSIETGIDPHAGMNITLTASVVAILVSRLNLGFIIVASIGLVILQNIIEWNLNAQWRDGITFGILLIVLIVRTEGIVSYNLRKDR